MITINISKIKSPYFKKKKAGETMVSFWDIVGVTFNLRTSAHDTTANSYTYIQSCLMRASRYQIKIWKTISREEIK